MTTLVVSTHQAKSRLSELIRAAERGDDVIVARNGAPVAKIIPWPASQRVRAPGSWAGRIDEHHDVVGPDPAVAAVFDESASTPEPA